MGKTNAAHVVNGIGHFDIEGPDVASLGRFYTGVFGWVADVRGPGYTSLETPAGASNGAIVEADDARLTVGIVVADLAGALASSVELGGRVVMPATDNGWVHKAQVEDPAGNRLTLIQG